MKTHPLRILRSTLFTSCLIALLSGCAFQAGEPWGYVDSSIALDDSHLEAPAELTIDSVQLTAHALRLYSSAASANNAPFDPANPPPGYSQCHGGHCHAADGSLPTYAEVAAATSGQNLTQTLAASSVLAENLTETQQLSSELKILQRTTLNTAEIEISRLQIHGSAHIDNDSRSLLIDIPLDNVRLTSPIYLTFDRDSEHHQHLPLMIELSHELLETIELDKLTVQSDGSIAISPDHNSDAAAALAQSFQQSSMVFSEDDHDHDHDHDHNHDYDHDHDHDHDS